MERILMLESHAEPLEGGKLLFSQGNYYIIDDEALRQSLIDAKKAVPESHAFALFLEQAAGAAEARKAVLAVPAVPEVAPVPEGTLDVPPPPGIPPIEVPE